MGDDGLDDEVANGADAEDDTVKIQVKTLKELLGLVDAKTAGRKRALLLRLSERRSFGDWGRKEDDGY